MGVVRRGIVVATPNAQLGLMQYGSEPPPDGKREKRVVKPRTKAQSQFVMDFKMDIVDLVKSANSLT